MPLGSCRAMGLCHGAVPAWAAPSLTDPAAFVSDPSLSAWWQSQGAVSPWQPLGTLLGQEHGLGQAISNAVHTLPGALQLLG